VTAAFLRRRSSEPEFLDGAETPEPDIVSSYAFMAWTNRWFGGTRAVLDYFERHRARAAAGGGPFTVLDLGTGAGDVPYALWRWAVRRGEDVRITAIDTHPAAIRYAASRHASPVIRYALHSAHDLDRLGDFDYIISSMFFHHLADAEIVELLGAMARHARRGFIVNDLERGAAAYAGAALLGRAFGGRAASKDAPVSVKRGFLPEDFDRYRRAARLGGLRIERRPFFRITLSWHV
jgi:2-polyprenyl-3-methyl-5-hydroxy-6-metoxy-1,4-benzoquinol methylase